MHLPVGGARPAGFRYYVNHMGTIKIVVIILLAIFGRRRKVSWINALPTFTVRALICVCSGKIKNKYSTILKCKELTPRVK